MTADLPYPGPPQQADEPPQWIKALWWAVSRVAAFGVGAVLAFLPDGTDAQVTLGGGLMIAASGFAVLSGFKR
jgi:hypothetical protein